MVNVNELNAGEMNQIQGRFMYGMSHKTSHNQTQEEKDNLIDNLDYGIKEHEKISAQRAASSQKIEITGNSAVDSSELASVAQEGQEDDQNLNTVSTILGTPNEAQAKKTTFMKIGEDGKVEFGRLGPDGKPPTTEAVTGAPGKMMP